ncbi:MAG TPA: response regulator transcription factor [Synergistaceae bacterium]|nr:response regulator transcription factor [Synergistaceae bacterium]HPQ37889.1 response regulator transcription factor [Synergistaceae bacterium]
MPDERILVVEDEATIADLIAEGLRRHGYLVERARDGDTALDMAETLVPDLIVLDLMLPGMDGWEICRRIRQYRKTRDVPILMLTARRDERDVVAGLELGADDYMKKPFSMNELMARVKALLRRTARKAPEEKHIVEGPLEWDVGAGMFRLEGEVLDLSPTEYRLLEELVLRRGKVVLREELLYKVWGYYGGDSRTVDVHISRLRRKVEEDPEHPLLVHTIRGRGYCLEWREKK